MKKILASLIICSSTGVFAAPSSALFINNIDVKDSVEVTLTSNMGGRTLRFKLGPLEACYVNKSSSYIPARKSDQTMITLSDGSTVAITRNDTDLNILPNELSTGVNGTNPRFYVPLDSNSWVGLDYKSTQEGLTLIDKNILGYVVGVVADSSNNKVQKEPNNSVIGHIFSCEDKDSGFGNAQKI